MTQHGARERSMPCVQWGGEAMLSIQRASADEEASAVPVGGWREVGWGGETREAVGQGGWWRQPWRADAIARGAAILDGRGGRSGRR